MLETVLAKLLLQVAFKQITCFDSFQCPLHSRALMIPNFKWHSIGHANGIISCIDYPGMTRPQPRKVSNVNCVISAHSSDLQRPL